MSRAFVPGLKVEADISVRRIRELPIPGEILVELGQCVTANEKVAQANLPGELYILRITEKLGIEAFEVIKALRVKEGDEVTEGQLLCEHVGLFGLFRNRYIAPASGTIELVTERTGHLGLRLASVPIELDAYVSGEIVSIEAGKSIEIETRAVLVQGIFGVGGEKHGRITMLDVAPNKVLELGDLPKDCSDCILVGGMRPSHEVLATASALGAVGFVTGSIDDRALKEFLGFDLGIALTGDEELSMSLIVTEGFGTISMSMRIIDLLSSRAGAEASINGATQVRAGAIRPEIIIPHVGNHEQSSTAEPIQEEISGLCIGSRVRLIRVPYFGLRAEVIELPSIAEKIETGAHARVLRARLEECGEVVTVPRANVELV